jgi:hypothetical protein
MRGVMQRVRARALTGVLAININNEKVAPCTCLWYALPFNADCAGEPAANFGYHGAKLLAFHFNQSRMQFVFAPAVHAYVPPTRQLPQAACG